MTSEKSEATARKRLQIVGVPDDVALPSGQLCAQHIKLIKGRLVKARAVPATLDLALAVLRGIARQARTIDLMTDEGYRRLTELRDHKGERAPTG